MLIEQQINDQVNDIPGDQPEFASLQITNVVTPTIPSVSNAIITPPSYISYTPRGNQEWLREVGKELTPHVNQVFNSLDEGIKFYEVYATACGFDTRLSSSKRFPNCEVIRTKEVCCNRQGKTQSRPKTDSKKISNENKKPNQKTDSSKHSNENNKPNTQKVSKIRRFQCKARILLKYLKNGQYYVKEFYEGHSHKLVHLKNKEFMKSSKNLNSFHKETILNHSKVNIGVSQSYKVVKGMVNGYENIGANLQMFRNFYKEVKCYIGSADGEMFISTLGKLANQNKGFSYFYELDDKKNLTRIFWCDGNMKRAYQVFGDAVSYDPTYGTQKYFMVFTPFSGVDNHKKTVTFASALLSNEDEESFVWAFTKFREVMGGKEPQYIITDQCPALKKAVPAVFQTAKHRFCMWHIMSKVVDKVDLDTCKNTNFLDDFGNLVWDMEIDAVDFEDRWYEIMRDYKQEENDWLEYMFQIRHKWIPAFFHDLPMGNILKTTQRSESSNSFFKKLQNEFGTLVEFWFRYETAIDHQQHIYKQLEVDSDTVLVKPITPLLLESDALPRYTQEVAIDFQEEVRLSLCACGVVSLTSDGDIEITVIQDSAKKKKFEVHHDVPLIQFSCSCKLFERRGLLCRHIVWVLGNRNFKAVPEKYIMPRWTKNILRKPMFDIDGNLIDDYAVNDAIKIEMTNLWSEFYATISIVGKKDVEEVKALSNILKQFRESLGCPTLPLSKEKEMEQLLGVSKPNEINILPPNVSNNKGSRKRMLSEKERAIKKAKRAKRKCANCKRMTHHDKRNCPHPTADKPPEEYDESSESE